MENLVLELVITNYMPFPCLLRLSKRLDFRISPYTLRKAKGNKKIIRVKTQSFEWSFKMFNNIITIFQKYNDTLVNIYSVEYPKMGKFQRGTGVQYTIKGTKGKVLWSKYYDHEGDLTFDMIDGMINLDYNAKLPSLSFEYLLNKSHL